MTESLKLAAPCGLYCGVCSTFSKRLAMVVDATLKTVLQQKSIKSAPFTNVSEKKVFKTANIFSVAYGIPRPQVKLEPYSPKETALFLQYR